MEQLGSTVTAERRQRQTGPTSWRWGASTGPSRAGEVGRQVVTTMKGHHDSQQARSRIISVIDRIAFQTQHPALNAASKRRVPANRARGPSPVVANEVAAAWPGRSADAAKESKALIPTASERVATGTELSDQAGTTIEHEVSASVQARDPDIMGEISAASSEQSSVGGAGGRGGDQNDADDAAERCAGGRELLAAPEA